MTYTAYQLEILVIGLVAFLFEFASGTLLARGFRLGSGAALVVSIIAGPRSQIARRQGTAAFRGVTSCPARWA
ncbi:MAG: hypothetical protein DME06_12150 [Candidatus Rokuibacteriota bacterium]|nr:MAG: hypothetical protein DME06_12150 [Candidatus Rokubacteria bacterium]